jgi:TnpA family transposase
MKDTNTHENLLLIYQAMSAIEKNDRSLYFLNYYKEVQERIRELYELSKYEKNSKKST